MMISAEAMARWRATSMGLLALCGERTMLRRIESEFFRTIGGAPDRTAQHSVHGFCRLQQRRTWIVPTPVHVMNSMSWWIETAAAEKSGRDEILEFIAPDVGWIEFHVWE